MRKVLVIDTDILCVWLDVPGMDDAGPQNDRWDFGRVDEKIEQEIGAGTYLVLPVASIIETGNHIAHAGQGHRRRECALRLAKIMADSADENEPWAAFSRQAELWSPERLKTLAESWPDLACQGISLGDATIKDVAELYAQARCQVEILTGDQGLKAHQPVEPPEIPRRRRSK